MSHITPERIEAGHRAYIGQLEAALFAASWERMICLATLAPFAKAAEQFAWPCFAPSAQIITPGTDLYVKHLRSARDVTEQAAGIQNDKG